MAKQKQADFSQGSGEVLSTSGKVIRGICSLIMILYSCITIFVLVVTVMDSLKAKGDLVTNFVGLPKAVSLSSYASVLIDGDFLLYFKNSLVLTVCGTVGCILLSSMAAYGIARYQFKGKSLLTGYFMVGMMVPVQVSILPLFIILRNLGLLNKLSGLILVYISGISMSCLIFHIVIGRIAQQPQTGAANAADSLRADGFEVCCSRGKRRIYERDRIRYSEPQKRKRV